MRGRSLVSGTVQVTVEAPQPVRHHGPQRTATLKPPKRRP